MSAESPETLESLLEERDRYAGWLARLAARGDAAPSHVVDRVRADYEARLATVRERIAARAGELESEVAAARDRLERAQAAEQKAHDERAEAEVRHAVGEYSTERWEVIARESDAALASLGADHAAARAEVERLESALAAARSAPATPTSPMAAAGEPMPGESAPEHGIGDVVPEVIGEPPVVPPAEAEHAGAAGPGAVDERAERTSGLFDAPVTDAEAEAGTAGPGDAGAPPAGEAPAPPAAEGERGELVSGPDFDDLAFLKSLAPTPGTPPVTIPRVSAPIPQPPAAGEGASMPTPVGEPQLPVADPSADEAPFTRPPTPAEPSPATPEPGRAPAPTPSTNFLRSVRPSEGTQSKTLRCGECGTMNYPTEWYCERCGGELASM